MGLELGSHLDSELAALQSGVVAFVHEKDTHVIESFVLEGWRLSAVIIRLKEGVFHARWFQRDPHLQFESGREFDASEAAIVTRTERDAASSQTGLNHLH